MSDKEQEQAMARLKELGERIGRHMPEGWGFVLMIFPFGEGNEQFMHYVSNAEREDVLTMMVEFIQRSQEKGMFGKHIDRGN